MNTQTRTTMLLVISFLSLILIIIAFIYYATTTYAYDSFFQLLEVKAITAAKATIDNKAGSGVRKLEEVRNEAFSDLSEEIEYIIPLNNVNGKDSIAQQTQLPLSFIENIIERNKANYRLKNIFYTGILYKNGGEQYVVIAGASNDNDVNQANYLFKISILSVFISLLIALLLSAYFTYYFFLPIRKISARVNQISSENLHLRLEDNNKNDELSELTSTFNNMLDRIEFAFETMNNFISNASHELRTPLTAIIGEADVALSKPRTQVEYEMALSIILQESEKLDAKTRALLFLAQTGFDGKTQRFDKVRIDQLIWDVRETIVKIHPKSRININMEMLPETPVKLKVKGNEQLLHLAFSNIINNACKYSNYKVVQVFIEAIDNKVIVMIKDQGIGIPKEEIKYIYDPFFRASNTKNHEGYGIGLPLTLNIIRMHQGEIKVHSIENEGTTVGIELPIGFYQIE